MGRTVQTFPPDRAWQPEGKDTVEVEVEPYVCFRTSPNEQERPPCTQMLTVGRKISCFSAVLKLKKGVRLADSFFLNRTYLAGYGTQFPWKEMIWRPGTTDRKLHIFELFSGG